MPNCRFCHAVLVDGKCPNLQCESDVQVRAPVEFSATERATIRDAIELWADDTKKLASVLEVALYEKLRRVIPDPGDGIGQLATAVLPMALQVLGCSGLRGPVCVTINGAGEDVLDDAKRLESLLDDPEANRSEVAELTAKVEPYVLVIPWDLYRRLSDRSVTLWLHRIAAEERSR